MSALQRRLEALLAAAAALDQAQLDAFDNSALALRIESPAGRRVTQRHGPRVGPCQCATADERRRFPTRPAPAGVPASKRSGAAAGTAPHS